jgi:hypothetical protein
MFYNISGLRALSDTLFLVFAIVTINFYCMNHSYPDPWNLPCCQQ